MRRRLHDRIRRSQRYAGFSGYDPTQLAVDANGISDFIDVTDAGGNGPITIAAARDYTLVAAFKDPGLNQTAFSLGYSGDNNTYCDLSAVLKSGETRFQYRVRNDAGGVNVSTVATDQDLTAGGWSVSCWGERDAGGGSNEPFLCVNGGTVHTAATYTWANGPHAVGLDGANIFRLYRSSPALYFGGRWGWLAVLAYEISDALKQAVTSPGGWRLVAPHYPGSVFDPDRDHAWWIDWVPGGPNPAPPVIYDCVRRDRRVNATMAGSLVAGDIVGDPQT